ncbi:putative transcriptional regulator YheO [Pseudomonas sp. TE24901]
MLSCMKKTSLEETTLISQLEQIAEGLSQTFSPFCEVVLHDLRDPQHAILAIHNNLSGRAPGDPATELGLARIADPEYPQIIANYQNQFSDGRQVKSTSIGIKDASGQYVAALCMNVDLSLFRGLQSLLEQFGSVSGDKPGESLDPSGADAIRARIDQFAARLATTPRALKAADRRLLMQELKDSGCMDVRRAMETVASHLGVSRAAVYTYAK